MPAGSARAIWFPRAGAVEIRTEELPPVGAEEVRIRALASAISHGTEMLVYRGQVPAGLALDLPTLRGSYQFPIKFGYASAGRVVEVGPAVEDRYPGDLVFTLHPHQTEYVVPATATVRLPDTLDPQLGVFTANLETAINVLWDAAPRLGEKVAVSGLGIVGQLIVRLLEQAGAGLIIGIDPIAGRRSLAQRGGANVTLEPGPDLINRVKELTEGAGVDVAIEASGQGAALNPAIEYTAFQGTLVVCSWYGTKPVTLDLGGHFHRGRLRVVSSQVGSIDPALQARWSFERRLALARNYLGRLDLIPLITHRIPFERAAEAYDLVDRSPEGTGQVILTYAG